MQVNAVLGRDPRSSLSRTYLNFVKNSKQTQNRTHNKGGVWLVVFFTGELKQTLGMQKNAIG
jgi:hypothetical protein